MTQLHFRGLSSAYSNLPTAEQSTSKPLSQGTTNLVAGSNGNAQPLRMMTTREATSGNSNQISKNSVATTTAQTNLMGLFHSDPLAAQTIAAQTWTVALPVREGNGAANAFADVALYVWRPSTNSKVGTIYDTSAQLGSEWPTTLTNSSFTFSGSSVTTQEGDHLVLEIWSRGTQSMGTAYALQIGTNYTTGEADSFLESTNDLTFPSVNLDLVRVIDDGLEPSETRTKRAALRRVRAETAEQADALLYAIGRLRIIADALDSSEARASGRAMRRLDARTLQAADARQPLLVRLRLLSDAMQVVDATQRLRDQLRLRGETTELADARLTFRDRLRVFSEALEAQEALARFRALRRLRADTVNAGEVRAALRGLLRLLEETGNISEAHARFADQRRVHAATLELTAARLTLRTLLRRVAESVEVGWGVLYELANRVVSLALSFLNVTPFSIQADGVESASIILAVRDTDNLPYEGILPAQVELQIEAIAVSAANSEVTATGAIAANGSDVATVTITVRDASNRPIPDVLPTIAVSGTGNSITQPTQRTNQSGQTTGQFTTTVAESKTVTAAADDVTITDTATVVAS